MTGTAILFVPVLLLLLRAGWDRLRRPLGHENARPEAFFFSALIAAYYIALYQRLIGVGHCDWACGFDRRAYIGAAVAFALLACTLCLNLESAWRDGATPRRVLLALAAFIALHWANGWLTGGLDPQLELHARVVDQNGRGVPDVRVHYQYVNSLEGEQLAALCTGADGRFALLPPMRASQLTLLDFHHPAYGFVGEKGTMQRRYDVRHAQGVGTPLPSTSEEQPLLFRAVEKSSLHEYSGIRERLLGLDNTWPAACRDGRLLPTGFAR